MLTFGGHKGSVLSTMIELMAGPLIGDVTSRESIAFDGGAKAAPMHGELILVFNPDLMGSGNPQANADRAEALFTAFADQGAHLPSQRRFAARERSLKNGVRVPAPRQGGHYHGHLATAGVDYHVPFGGTKGSSYGPREPGFAAADFFTMTKTSYGAG